MKKKSCGKKKKRQRANCKRWFDVAGETSDCGDGYFPDGNRMCSYTVAGKEWVETPLVYCPACGTRLGDGDKPGTQSVMMKIKNFFYRLWILFCWIMCGVGMGFVLERTVKCNDVSWLILGSVVFFWSFIKKDMEKSIDKMLE